MVSVSNLMICENGVIFFDLRMDDSGLKFKNLKAKFSENGAFTIAWPGGKAASKALHAEVATRLDAALKSRFGKKKIGPERFGGCHRMITHDRVKTRGRGWRRR